jgi:hypothetical protein
MPTTVARANVLGAMAGFRQSREGREATGERISIGSSKNLTA